MTLTLELGLHLPPVGGEAPESVAPRVLDQQQSRPVLRQAAHHPGEALPMQLCGKHKSPGGAVAVWQLEGLIELREDQSKRNNDSVCKL